ncbi:MAG: diguanylate cyclase [Clostridiales Family XIII bacterium]|jgi:diguanylate cyclase (GGDEF)-like protein|nr:diguanylate cyclase [Clostridiales Family XIII bacterium]
MNEMITQATRLLSSQIADGAPAQSLFLAVLVFASAIYAILAFVYKKYRSWESSNFILLCIPVFLWALSLLLRLYFKVDGAYLEFARVMEYAAHSFIPGLVCLHIWSQVSYKPITHFTVIRYFIIPVVLAADMIFRIFDPTPYTFIFTDYNFSLEQIISGGYLIIITARCYLLCFNVFYQMPRHMRRSTHYMIIAVSFIAAAKCSALLVSPNLALMLEIFAIVFALERFFSAFQIANSSNVIVTSREFVFGNLSTIVLTVSLKGRILDWNKKAEDGFAPLPLPQYKQPIEKYREQIIREGSGIVSPHDANIITTTFDGSERHYQFVNHEIRHKGRLFGYLVEISEVTKLYSVLRYLEEIAMFDQLTEMYNRNAYMSIAPNMIDEANMPLTLIVGDVNGLKQMNDAIGHLCGDRLLMTVATLVQEEAPEVSFAARIGGDEIVLLVPKGSDKSAQDFIKRVDSRCAAINDKEFGSPGISWGYAIMNSVNDDYNKIFSQADAMMYQRKKQMKAEAGIGNLSGFVPPEAKAMLDAVVKSSSVVKATAEAKAVSESETKAASEAKATSEAKAATKAASETKAATKATSEAKAASETKAANEAKATREAKAANETKAVPQSDAKPPGGDKGRK